MVPTAVLFFTLRVRAGSSVSAGYHELGHTDYRLSYELPDYLVPCRSGTREWLWGGEQIFLGTAVI